jgi:ABC-type multidrug transport system ATPase subunit
MNAACETPPSLAIRSVSKSYGSVQANRDISLTVPAGAIVGLLGPNGAGKTTLIRICAGLIDPDAGEILVNDVPLFPTRTASRGTTGLVSRDTPFYDDLTVAETVRLQATRYGLRGAARAAACARVIADYRLDAIAGQRIGTLSSGMLQRTVIAAAVVHAPALILLDEPTVGLDPEVRQQIWSCLAVLRDQGTAMLLTTHYLEEAARLCTEVHLLVDGRIARSMRPEGGSAAPLEKAYLAAVQQEPPAR